MLDPIAAGQYRRDGHVVVRDVLDPDLLGLIHRHLAACVPSPAGLVALGVDADPVVTAVSTDARLVGLARGVLPSEPTAFGFTYVVKEPRFGRPVLWHQDGHPWREQLGIDEAVTVWIALDPATRESGGLRVVPGSHRLPLTSLRANDEEPNVFGWEIDPELVDDDRATDIELEPGDVSLHHPGLVHSSGPNRTDQRRAALAIRYRAR